MISKYYKVRFLIGGTGNQLQQYMTSSQGSLFSNFFNTKPISKIFKLSFHENFIEFPSISTLHLFTILPLVFFDYLLSRFFSFSIFTNFDINSTKSLPFFHLFDVGYFLDQPYQKKLPKLKNFKYYNKIKNDEYACIHIRGGDLLKSNAINKYGHLNEIYYAAAISEIKHASIKVISDDIAYARKLLASFNRSFEYKNRTLIDDFYTGLFSTHFISSNSTLSYWIVKYRESLQKQSYVPSPFWKVQDWHFSSIYTKKINSKYK